MGAIALGPVDPGVTFALRRQVLRPHQPIEQMSRLDSGGPETLVVAARTESGEVVATGAVMPEAAPPAVAAALPPGRQWRLRAMATREDVRRSGVGAAVLGTLVDHVATRGGGVLWCAARVPALTFYRRAGFETTGTPWEDPDIGPHVHMWTTVEGRPPGGSR